LLYVTAKSIKKKIVKRTEQEELYLFLSGKDTEPTEVGRCQFYEWETYGNVPSDPDLFFLSLAEGKKSFNILVESIRETYLTFEWWGWYQYWVDWKGNRWMLRYIMSWHPDPPKWLFNEEEHEL
jgi:hypothetical protein